jgi:signal transduction histidine kinase
MNRNPFFSRSRFYLTACYAGVMGVILAITGIGIYQLVAWERWQALEQELNTLTNTLHDAIEPMLQTPEVITPDVAQVIPGLCLKNADCQSISDLYHFHVLGVIQQSEYSVQLFDLRYGLLANAGQSGQGIPLLQPSSSMPPHRVSDHNGQRYYLISLRLKTHTGQAWGYLGVGRSLQRYDAELARLRLFLLFGFPLLLLLITWVSWWLVGLALQPVYHSYRQVQQFTADAAHELRTPLAAIQATVETGFSPLDSAEIETLQATILRQTQRLNQLTSDLLLLSRLDLHLLALRQQPCNLQEIASDLVEEFAALALAAQIDLVLELRQPQPLWVHGDPEQLYRLVTNLLNNGLQHTPAGGQVSVRLDSNGQALLQVADTGVGIAATEQPRIFDRFYRVASDRSRQTGGAGLGLAIAQAIAQAHQGKISLWSQPGQGSVFTLRLPLAPNPALD